MPCLSEAVLLLKLLGTLVGDVCLAASQMRKSEPLAPAQVLPHFDNYAVKEQLFHAYHRHSHTINHLKRNTSQAGGRLHDSITHRTLLVRLVEMSSMFCFCFGCNCKLSTALCAGLSLWTSGLVTAVFLPAALQRRLNTWLSQQLCRKQCNTITKNHLYLGKWTAFRL